MLQNKSRIKYIFNNINMLSLNNHKLAVERTAEIFENQG
jgi:hypothetical protein